MTAPWTPVAPRRQAAHREDGNEQVAATQRNQGDRAAANQAQA